MAGIALEDILKSILDKTNRQQRNPARHPALSTGRLDELPIAISAGSVNFVVNPQWGSYILGDEVEDHFTNQTGAVVDLNTHTSDSGDSWTKRIGTINVETAGYVIHGGADSIYTVARSSGDMYVSAYTNTVSDRSGVIFRYLNNSNYWHFYAPGNSYRLFLTGSGDVLTGLGTTAVGDEMSVVCIDEIIFCLVNRSIIGIFESAALKTASNCGLWVGSAGGAHIDEFHAGDITSTDIDFSVDPGHTFWGVTTESWK